jgi:hypothetical protein
MPDVAAAAYPSDMDIVDDDEGFARTDEEMRRVLDHARASIARYGFGEELHPADLARPWGVSAQWQDNAWLRGVRDILECVVSVMPASPQRPPLQQLRDDVGDRHVVMLQGRKIPVEPGWPPPQTAEAWDATLKWIGGSPVGPPACEHGGAYTCSCMHQATTEARAALR